MQTERRLAFVVPWRESGQWLWKHLPDKGYRGDILSTSPRQRSFSLLPPYLREFWHLAASRVSLQHYDVIFAWELRTALAVGLVRKLHAKNRKSCFVAVGPILKGPVLSVLPLVRWLLGEADKIVCFSREECDKQARTLNLPQSRFVFVPTAWENEEIAANEGDYILALGHSGRDYPTLLEAVRDTGQPVLIAARTAADLGNTTIPPNVTVRYRTEQDETDALIAGARLQVLPLLDGGHSAGQSVLLRSMAQGKAVIVTDTSGIRDYVRDGETAILVSPGDATALRSAIERLWGDAAERNRIGGNAARIQRQEYSFPQLTERLVLIAEEVIQASNLRS